MVTIEEGMAYAKESVIVEVVVVLSHFGLANSHRHRYNLLRFNHENKNEGSYGDA